MIKTITSDRSVCDCCQPTDCDSIGKCDLCGNDVCREHTYVVEFRSVATMRTKVLCETCKTTYLADFLAQVL